MDLVTVTCSRDKLQMLLQAESICNFVEPTTHWVIVNDPVVTLSEWKGLLSPYYTSHQLNLINANDFSVSFDNSKGGWSRQQTYKFLAYKLINDDFLTLDSKNFFIKHCSTSEWQNITGCGSLANFENLPWEDTVNYYSDYLNIEKNYNHLSIITPFVFHKAILDKIDDYDNFINWFAAQPVIESEYLLYSALCYKHNCFPAYGKIAPKSLTVTSKYNFSDFDFFKILYTSDRIKVAGLHFKFLEKLSEFEKSEVTAWLQTLGLTTNIFG
jgi:hypothetical protein